MTPRNAVYAGTFDPVTLGHLSVIERSAGLFDRLWVVVAINPDKEPLFTPEERVSMLSEVTVGLPNVAATSTAGYVVELARRVGARYLVRGVRGATDADSELGLARLNHELAPEIETVFVPAHGELSEVSSSRLKELVQSGADITRYCSVGVAARLRQRLVGTLGRDLKEATHV
jgi:pantetheine-phosphate adenylyltransferase